MASFGDSGLFFQRSAVERDLPSHRERPDTQTAGALEARAGEQGPIEGHLVPPGPVGSGHQRPGDDGARELAWRKCGAFGVVERWRWSNKKRLQGT